MKDEVKVNVLTRDRLVVQSNEIREQTNSAMYFTALWACTVSLWALSLSTYQHVKLSWGNNVLVVPLIRSCCAVARSR
jgi:hypothetical protein